MASTSTARQLEPRPELILFDAVGTLIYPEPAAGEVYRECARRFGCAGVDQASDGFDYKLRLIQAMHQVAVTRRQERQGQTGEVFEYECWRQIVRHVFATCAPDAADQLFVELWNYFADARSWQLFPDVAPTLAALQQRGYRIGIASNFDGRLLGLCRELSPLDQIREIYVSSQVGWSKPAAEFYAAIQSATQIASERILMVGDDCQCDHLAPQRHGWQSRWLVRQAAEPAADQIRSLDQLLATLP